ncbi:IclR family transcriptional regulator [Pseudomonas fluorescens]|uniref:IclR family transcriptional regulator n=1 Tax=Pseudomonas fluorescens TaxID=294 RepID=UPI0019124764|nr:helix-turn-helix domain-containing protein [Pseudomonas fluorescens]
MEMDSDDDNAKTMLTVSRGLQVLRVFRGERAALSNAQIVSRSGLPKATVSRLTSTLIRSGFLRHVVGGRQFELASGSLGIGHAFVESSPLVQLAQPFMQQLADELNVSVALAVGNQMDMLYVAYCSGKHIATLRLGIGSLLPMANTAIGRAYLWGLPDVQQYELLATIRAKSGDEARTLQLSIDKSFTELATTGTCFVRSGYQRDAFGIALPVKVGVERKVMGFSCGAVDIGSTLISVRNRIEPALKDAAPRLEQLLASIESVV